MAASERTKQLLAEGIKQMSETTSFRKIRVGELCRHCGVDRRTFYYHFRDIYDLAAWIFNQAVDASLIERNGHFQAQELVRTLTSLSSDPVFYRRALAEDSQNALGRHIMEHNLRMYEAAACRLRGVDRLNEQDSFAIRYHTFGSLAMIRRWMFADCKPGPEVQTELLLHAMPPILQEVYGLTSKTEEDRHAR